MQVGFSTVSYSALLLWSSQLRLGCWKALLLWLSKDLAVGKLYYYGVLMQLRLGGRKALLLWSSQ